MACSTSTSEYTMNISQGATYKLGFTWKNKTTGEAIDITSANIVMELKSARGAVFTYDNGGNGGITITDATAGKFDLAITDEQTLAYTFTTGRYIILVEFPNGEKSKFLSGKVKVTPKFR